MACSYEVLFIMDCKRGIFNLTMNFTSDFRGYARPSRLFPAKEAKICSGNPEKYFLNNVAVDDSQSSLIKVKLQTSRISGSSLSDINAGILLCIIDENGDSILLRIPSMRGAEQSSNLEDPVDHENLSFQRGSVDGFTFKGPPLEQVQALWIGVESGLSTIVGLLARAYESTVLQLN